MRAFLGTVVAIFFFAFIVNLVGVFKKDSAEASTVLALLIEGGLMAWAAVLLFGAM